MFFDESVKIINTRPIYSKGFPSIKFLLGSYFRRKKSPYCKKLFSFYTLSSA